LVLVTTAVDAAQTLEPYRAGENNGSHTFYWPNYGWKHS
jgi:hypothetical protein